MGVLRTVVFPAARLLVWAVIAVALCVLAFGGARGPAADPLVPTADTSESLVAASRGTVSNTLELTGTVSADPAVEVKATAAGSVRTLRAAVGDHVAADTPVLDVLVTLPPREPAVSADGDAPPVPAKPRTKTVTVRAGSAGTLTSLAVLEDQEVTVGTVVASVSPGTLTLRAPLTQAQQFRLLAPPSSAQVQAPGGPAPFACTDLRVEGPSAAAPAQPSPDPFAPPSDPAGRTSAATSCRVPPDATVFAGMTATMTVEAGTATDVVVVPVTAVLGTVGTGTVWLAEDDGATTERTITLGLTDGSMVEVREGLAEGEQVLEFAPAPVDDEAAQTSEAMEMGW